MNVNGKRKTVYEIDSVIRVYCDEYRFKNMLTDKEPKISASLFELLVLLCQCKINETILKYDTIKKILGTGDYSYSSDNRIPQQIYRLNSLILGTYNDDGVSKKKPISNFQGVGYFLDYPCKIWGGERTIRVDDTSFSQQTSRSQIPSEKLYEGIRQLILKIPDAAEEMSNDDSVSLVYEPSDVDKKLPGRSFEEKALHDKINSYVAEYFNVVKKCFDDLIAQNLVNETAIREKMKRMYVKYSADEDDDEWKKTWTFESITNWMNWISHADKETCEIVASYFVESCEVFEDETTGQSVHIQ